MMKKILFFIFIIQALWGYDSIDEALKNGISRGDLIFFGDYQGLSKGRATIITPKNLATYGYLGNTGYLFGNVGLSYTSGFYKNIRAAIGFRAGVPLWNLNKNLQTPYGKGDASKDFFNQNQATLSESFFEYFDGDTNIKAGRIIIPNEWINTMTDGVWIRNRSFKNLMLEGFWINDYGRVAYYQMTQFNKTNPYSNAGLFNLSVKYYFLPTLTLKAYTFFTPKIFTAFGSRLEGKYEGSKIYFGGNIGFTYSIEGDKIYSGFAHNAYALDSKIFFGMKYFEIAAGYINTSRNSGWGNLGIIGDNIDPFFVWGGKAIKTQVNGNLIYGSISANIDKFKFSLIYGSTSYGISSRQNELDFSTEINFTQNISGILNLTNTHKDDINIPTLTEINGGIRLSF